MGPKRRMILSDTSDEEEDSFKHRRTSLKVNLSYANLTDSGNGSLWKTEIENEEVPHKVQASKELSRSKNKSTGRNCSQVEEKDNHVASEHATGDNDKMSGLNDRVKGVQLKDLRIHLEDISTKERALETNCKRLKDAILSKTKEVFDKEHELSIKITKVLRNENKCCANAENESVLELNKTTERASNIVETPTSNHHHNTTKKRRSTSRDIDQSKLPHRQLFDKEDEQEGDEQKKCQIIENVILKNRPLNILQQSEQSSSPILSGSKRLSLLRKRSKDRTSKLNNTYSTICSVQSCDIGAPIVCSTFIEDNAIDDKKAHRTVTNHPNSDMSPATQTVNTVISMEMTKTYGDNRASEKYECLQNRDPSPSKCVENEMERCKETSWNQNRSASTQRPKDVGNSKSVVKRYVESSDSHCTTDDEDEASAHEDTIIPGGKSVEEVAMMKKACETRESNNEIKIESEKQRTSSLSKSSETIRSSLNVNTSLDAVTDCDRDRNVDKSRRKLIILDDQRESTSTVRTSLQVNTSTNSVRRPSGKSNVFDRSSLPQDRYDPIEEDRSNANNRYSKVTENGETNNVDLLENISLFERLRNVSRRRQVPCKQSITIFGKQETNESKNAVNGKSQNNMRASGDSCVEATPYPVTRSVLFKTMLKLKTENTENSTSFCGYGTNLVNNGKESDVTKSSASIPRSQNKAPALTGTSKTVGTETVILEGTLSGDPFFVTQRQSLNCKSLAIRSPSFDDPSVVTQNKSIPENKFDKANLEVEEKKDSADSQSVEHVPLAKVGKRKLLPLSDGSQLCSITPIDENKCPVTEKSPVKRIKKLKKKKILNLKMDTIVNKHKKTNKSMLSDSDSENKKEQDKKTRKPRKVISKKIVVKKLADNNMLNVLEKENLIQNKRDLSGESRDSLDEFVKFRATKSIQRNNYKLSHKIVIVTTGLSKGDKSLVKSIVKSLGNAEMELNVSKRTTHVVSSGVRTVNLLRGIIRGCWLVTLEWVLKSLESNRWLNPEEFEMKHFSKAVQENRRDRQLFGPSYIPELFTTCGFIYVELKTTVPCVTLKELIKTAGGHITENIKLAKIIIGPSGLRETWVIDSITTGELQLTQLYKRQ